MKRQKIAIVGTSKISTAQEEVQVIKELLSIFDRYFEPTFISGGAKGIDIIVEEFAKKHNIPIKIFPPKELKFKSYRERDMEIAKYCDKLYCISTQVKNRKCRHHDPSQNHENTGGCWTMNEAEKLGKEVNFIKIEDI